MENQELLSNLKKLFDACIKSGMISNTEDGASLHQMYVIIAKKFSEEK